MGDEKTADLIPVYLYVAEAPVRMAFARNQDPSKVPPGWSLGNDGKPLFFVFNAPSSAKTAFDGKLFETAKVTEFITEPPNVRLYYGTVSNPAPGWRVNIDAIFYVFTHQIGNFTVPIYQFHQILPGNQWNLTYSLLENDPRYADFHKDGPQFFVFPA